jgi:hypothetical protein
MHGLSEEATVDVSDASFREVLMIEDWVVGGAGV